MHSPCDVEPLQDVDLLQDVEFLKDAHWSRSGQNCSKIIFSPKSTFNGPNNYKIRIFPDAIAH